jgi:hypothetical protein
MSVRQLSLFETYDFNAQNENNENKIGRNNTKDDQGKTDHISK